MANGQYIEITNEVTKHQVQYVEISNEQQYEFFDFIGVFEAAENMEYKLQQISCFLVME